MIVHLHLFNLVHSIRPLPTMLIPEIVQDYLTQIISRIKVLYRLLQVQFLLLAHSLRLSPRFLIRKVRHQAAPIRQVHQVRQVVPVHHIHQVLQAVPVLYVRIVVVEE